MLAPDTRIITVADREGDLYDLYHEAFTSTQTSSAYWLIRAMANRRLLDKDNNLQTLKLIETVEKMMESLVPLQYGLDYKDCEILLRLKIFMTALGVKKLMGNDVKKRGKIINFMNKKLLLILITFPLIANALNHANFLLNLKRNSINEIKTYRGIQNSPNFQDTHFKQNPSEIKLALQFKKLSIENKNIIGYAPVGTYAPNNGY